jgi:hypothetical protein
MNVKIGTEAAQFPEMEYINGIFVAVWRSPEAGGKELLQGYETVAVQVQALHIYGHSEPSYWCTPQSRQSDSFFSNRWNWDHPTPSTAGECVPPSLVPGGGARSLTGEGVGGGGPKSNEGTYTVVL